MGSVVLVIAWVVAALCGVAIFVLIGVLIGNILAGYELHGDWLYYLNLPWRAVMGIHNTDHNYHLVLGKCLDDIELQVRAGMKLGLEPLGGIAIQDRGNGDCWFFQAMIRPSERRGPIIKHQVGTLDNTIS